MNVLFTAIWFHAFAAVFVLSALAVTRWSALWQYMLTAFLGIVIAIIDLRSEEVQFTALLLLMFGFFSGFNEPKRAWRWGLLLGVWIPVFVILKLAALQDVTRIFPEGAGSFLALIFSFAGTYAGAFLRKLSNSKQPRNS